MLRRTLASTRRRYVLETAALIALLVASFAVVTLLAVSVRFLMVVENDAHTLVASLGDIDEGLTPRAAAVLTSLSSPFDPHVVIYRPDGRVAARSANQARPLPPARRGFRYGSSPAYRLVTQEGRWTVVVDWPLTPTLDLIHDLTLVLAATTALAAAAGALVGRYTIHRILAPVEAMSQAALAMREGRRALRMPELPGSGDEFARLAKTLTLLLQDLETRRQRDREFLARAAHELRTPLQVVAGNLRLLRRPDLDEEERQVSLRAIERAVERMARLTRDLLALEHAHEMRPDRQLVDVRALLEEIAEDGRALSPDHVVTVEADVAEAYLDAEATRRSLWALLENALRYTPSGSHIRLSAHVVQDELWLEVVDDGPGIPDDELGLVFERFYRGRSVRGTEGSGLGLAIVRSLTEAQGGSVHIEANAPHGTKVVLRLPSRPGP